MDIMSLVGGSLPNADLLPLSIAGAELQIISWNGHGICLFNPVDRLKMGPIIFKYSMNRHVVCFQGVHGNKMIFCFLFPSGFLGGEFFVLVAWILKVLLPRAPEVLLLLFARF